MVTKEKALGTCTLIMVVYSKRKNQKKPLTPLIRAKIHKYTHRIENVIWLITSA